jgi:hypothetical protein
MPSQLLDLRFYIGIPHVNFEIKTTTDDSLMLLRVSDISDSFLVTLEDSHRSC